MDIEALKALAAAHLPDWIKKATDREAWLTTFMEAFDETQDAIKAALAATGRVTKRRMLGLKSVDGAPVVAGWGLLFTDADDLDLQETYFDDDTRLLLDFYEGAPLFYEHGEDSAYGVNPIGRRLKAVLYPRGVWAEHTLDTNHPLFERTLAEAEHGELAYSSDSIGHLAEKEYNIRDGRLGFWAVAGWSLTKHPAEPALGAVTLKQFAGALKSMAREAHTQGSAAQPTTTHTTTNHGVTNMQPNEIFAALAAALGLPPDVSPEQLETAVQQAINDIETSPAAAQSMHAAMGGEASEEPDTASLSEKMNTLYKMACGKNDDDMSPEPLPTSMSTQRNYSALKTVAELASKSAPRGSSMPYMVNSKKGESRDYSTRGAPMINKGAKEPGVYDIARDMVLVSRGFQPETWRDRSAAAKAMSYATGPAGGYVLTQEVSENILDPLRAEAVLFNLGARQEDFDGIQIKQVPAMQTAPSAYWVGEGQTVTDSQPAYRMITLVPKPLATLVLRPFNFYKNMTPRAESQLQTQIRKSLALAIDLAGFTGTGGAAASPNTGSQPVGLLNISGVTQTTLATNGRQPTINDLIGAEKRVDAANVPQGGSRGWAFHTNVKHVFTGMTDANGQPIFRDAWGNKEQTELLGSQYQCSNQIPVNVTTGSNSNTSYIFYGAWEYMVIGMTTTVELVLDQTYAASLNQGLLAYVYVDIQLDYPEAFEVLTGVTYS